MDKPESRITLACIALAAAIFLVSCFLIFTASQNVVHQAVPSSMHKIFTKTKGDRSDYSEDQYPRIHVMAIRNVVPPIIDMQNVVIEEENPKQIPKKPEVPFKRLFKVEREKTFSQTNGLVMFRIFNNYQSSKLEISLGRNEFINPAPRCAYRIKIRTKYEERNIFAKNAHIKIAASPKSRRRNFFHNKANLVKSLNRDEEAAQKKKVETNSSAIKLAALNSSAAKDKSDSTTKLFDDLANTNKDQDKTYFVNTEIADEWPLISATKTEVVKSAPLEGSDVDSNMEHKVVPLVNLIQGVNILDNSTSTKVATTKEVVSTTIASDNTHDNLFDQMIVRNGKLNVEQLNLTTIVARDRNALEEGTISNGNSTKKIFGFYNNKQMIDD